MASIAVPFNATQVATNYSDNCGGPVTVIPTDTLIIGDNCGWVMIYTYKVVDVCGNALLNQTITHTGSDQIAPSGTPPASSLNNNGCKANATSLYPFNAAVAGAGYSDNCGNPITVTLTNTQVVGTDCAWAIIYTFSVKDECNNALNNQQMVISGSDQTPPVFTRPADITIYSNESCVYDASVAVTGDVTNEADFCSSSLNATYTDNTVANACNCSYTITRTWHLVDACGNAAPDQVQTITVVNTIVVNTNDSGPGSLRDVIACAPNNANITFSNTLMGQTITLTSGQIAITKNLTLSGLGVSNLTVSGNNASRIFELMSGNNFTVKNMTLKNATAVTNGGAIFAKGNLFLENVTFQNNFENGVARAITVGNTGSMQATGTILLMN